MAVPMLSIFTDLPPATRGLTGAIVGSSTVLFLLRFSLSDKDLASPWIQGNPSVAFPWIVLVPGSSFWYPWTLLTSAFCETSLFELILTLVSIPLMARYFEELWGGIELLKFAGVVLVLSNVIAWFLAIVQYVVLGTEWIMFGTQYHGMTALQTGFLVGFTQMIPEHRIQIFNGRLGFQVKNLPMAYVTISTVLCLLGFMSPWILIQFGWLISWGYLRFFKSNSAAGFRGDRSETFAFVNWFPPFLHTPIGIASNFAHQTATRLHIIQPWDYTDLEASPAVHEPFQPTGPPRAEAERRRAMALKALDQKMAAGSPGNNGQASASSGPAGPVRSQSASNKLGAAPVSDPHVLFSAEDDDEGSSPAPPDLLGNESDHRETADLLKLAPGKDIDEGDIGTSSQ